MKNSIKELSPMVNSLRDFLEKIDKASKRTQIPVAISEIECPKTKKNLFAQNHNDTIEYSNKQNC